MTAHYKAVVEAIGERGAVELTERLGGAPIYVPEHPSATSPIVLAIGHQLAAKICDHFSGQTIELPSRFVLERKRRRKEVIYDLRRGLPTSEIARRHGITQRHVRRLANEG